MPDRTPVPLSSMLTAGVFALVVISVFATLQNQGPESTVARYFQAVAAGDKAAEGQLIRQSVDNPSASALREFVLSASAPPVNRSVIKTIQLPRSSVVYVQISHPGFAATPIAFTLTKPRIRWKIDVDQTLDYLRPSP